MAKLIFMGPQGCGKGTQAKMVAEKLGLQHISTGDLLRNATGELGKKVAAVMESGQLVSDELIAELLQAELQSEKCQNGFILDGFPRNVAQAKLLKDITAIDKVIEISISDQASIDRVTQRVSCKQCGGTFNLKFNPPNQEMTCDHCSSPLTKRADDTEEALRKRLAIYHAETAAVVQEYNVVKINGEKSIGEVHTEILRAI